MLESLKRRGMVSGQAESDSRVQLNFCIVWVAVKRCAMMDQRFGDLTE